MIELVQALGVAYEENVQMSAKTTFKIGGPAELMLFPASTDELRACVKRCAAQGEKPFILGCGSNLLVKDSGLDGVAISTEKLTGVALAGEGLITCGAGVKLGELCAFAQKRGLAGLEFAYGIPGSAGGAAYMNAGAYGGEMKDILHSVQYIDMAGEICELPAEKLGLGYRSSVFMQNNGVIAGLTVQLSPGDPAEIKAKMNEILQKRRERQPLEFPSAGSVFKRPEGRFAGALIEQCGLKGKGVGGARVSEKHAGFIVNAGGATAADVRALIALVQAVVEAGTGVFLEPEIKFI
ncbi:MAG: UDP-N-acetylmuramate dehydrogenase [Oscillospiraceae bacterium]|jgi:UDP-N-acetylmuramate dehydrogenase|nr:UDP-N-acetylmuramate dehydrogenase [Oscillospiraceae bacterium]